MPFNPKTATLDFDPSSATIEDEEVQPRKKHFLDAAFRPETKLGITGAYSAPNINIGPGYGKRLQSDIEEQAKKDVERQQQGGNVPLSETAGGIQSMAAILRQAPGSHELGQVISGAIGKVGKVAPVQKVAEPEWKPPTFGTFSSPLVSPSKMMAESPNLRSATDIVTGAAEVIPTAVAGSKFLTGLGKNIVPPTDVSKSIKLGLDKGIAPKVKNKSSFSKMSNFNKYGKEAVETIAEHRQFIDIIDDVGEIIDRPRNAAEFAQAIEKTKAYIYKQYNEMAVAAGDAGARFNTKPILRKLKKLSEPDGFYKGNRGAQNHVNKIIDDISQLDGAAPNIVQERIREFNESLAGFYSGRAEKVGARIDGSVANLLRTQLDETITNASGGGYQPLKNKYRSLKAIEKEVNHRAVVNARQNNVGLVDMTDIFTGSDLAAGALTQNPALIARGVVGRGIKEGLKKLKDPNRHINKMFKDVYDEASYKPYSITTHTPEKPIWKDVSEAVQDEPAFVRKGLDPEGAFLAKQSKDAAVADAIRGLRPKVTSQQSGVEAMREFQRGVRPY